MMIIVARSWTPLRGEEGEQTRTCAAPLESRTDGRLELELVRCCSVNVKMRHEGRGEGRREKEEGSYGGVEIQASGGWEGGASL